MVRKPNNAIELLQNIKMIFDQHLLLREDFYEEATLRRVLGGDQILWQKREPTGARWGDISDFGNLVPPVQTGQRQSDGLGIFFRRDIRTPNGIVALLSLNFSSPQPPSFFDIERIFGPRWIVRHGDADTPHRIFRAPTHPHGNETIVYRQSASKIEQSWTFQFLPDGTLGTADFVIESKQ